MEVQVIHADITDEERRKVFYRAAVVAGMMLTEIKEKGLKRTSEKKEVNKNEEWNNCNISSSSG